jgi:hypothetical protein
MQFLRNTMAGPLVILLLICAISFMLTVASKGGQYCIEEVEHRGIAHVEILDWTMARMQGDSALAAVLVKPVKAEGKVLTVICHYKEDTFSLKNIEVLEGDKLAGVRFSRLYPF